MVQVARTGGRTLSVVIGVDVLAITERIRRTHLTAEKNEKVSLELELGCRSILPLHSLPQAENWFGMARAV